jgi:hypothetical protein
MTLKPSKVLRAAADLLEKGWCQRYLGVRDRASCWQAARKLGLPILYTAAHEFQLGVEIDRLCLQGAIMKASIDLMGVGWPTKEGTVTPEEEEMMAIYRASEHAVAEEIHRRGTVTGTARWNDVVGRQQDGVVALVQDVADQEENAGR